ncbi:MAG: glycosyltransferase [Opitutae bacterium]|nr:glycosyltransferase [Opitutae bacterium]
MKKIVQIGLDVTPSAGGSAIALSRIREALGGDTISFTGPDRQEEIHEGDGLLHLQTGRGLLGRLFHKPSVDELNRAENLLDGAGLIIVHTLYRYHTHWVAKQASQRNIPYWVVVHGGLDPFVLSYRRFRKMRWLQHFGQSYLRGASRVLFATHREHNKALPFLDGVNAETVHWPIKPFDLVSREKARQAWREKLNIGEGERLLLYLGRLQEVKRPLETLEAFRLANAPNLHIAFVGPPESYSPEDLIHIARIMGVPRVHAPGPVYRWKKDGLISASDALVSLSAKENFNLAAVEAMSAGKPVILSPGNDLQGELECVNCGWLLSTDSSSEAANAISELATISNDELSVKGDAARNWVNHHLGFEQFRDRLEELIPN